MALKLSISTSNVGVPFAEAYARITNIVANKDQCQYQVAVYATADARQANAQSVTWSAIANNQTAGWSDVNNSQPTSWTNIDDDQDPDWEDIPTLN